MNRPEDLAGVSRLALSVGQLSITVLVFGVAGAGAEKDLFDASLALAWVGLLVLAGPHVLMATENVMREAASDAWEARRTFSATVRNLVSTQALVASLGVAASGWLATTVFRGLESSERLGGLIRVHFVGLFLLSAVTVVATGGPRQERRILAWTGPALHAGGGAATAIVFGAATRVEDVAWGALIGASAALVVVIWRVERRGIGFDWRTPWMHRSVPSFVREIGTRTVVAGPLAIEAAIPAVAGQFAGEGSVALLTGLRWLVGATAALIISRFEPRQRGASLRTAMVVSGLATALLVALAYPLAGGVGSTDGSDPTRIATARVLVLLIVIATPFLVLTWCRPRSVGRGAEIGLGVLMVASVPIAAAAGRSLGPEAVATVWTLVLVATAGMTAWPKSESTTDTTDSSTGSGAWPLLATLLAVTVGFGVSVAGDDLDVAPLLTSIVGVPLTGVTWALVLRAAGADPWALLVTAGDVSPTTE